MLNAMGLIREYKAEDAQQVMACIVELQDYCRRIDSQIADGKTVAEKYLGYLLAQCVETDGKMYVVERDHKVVGMVCVFGKVQSDAVDEEDYEYAYISDLVVLASERNKGLGRALLKRAEEYARSKAAKILRLSVHAGNQAARDLYLGYGFQEKVVIMQKEIEHPSKDAI
jgi:ribosomal protein S18 acetylase RimI-like enzyme